MTHVYLQSLVNITAELQKKVNDVNEKVSKKNLLTIWRGTCSGLVTGDCMDVKIQ